MVVVMKKGRGDTHLRHQWGHALTLAGPHCETPARVAPDAPWTQHERVRGRLV